MPSNKTIATELSVGFGLLGISDPIENININALFDGTLFTEHYSSYLREYRNNTTKYMSFIQLGLDLRRKTFGNNIQVVHWTGYQQQAATIMTSKDLFIPRFNTPISVKDNSNVVANPSPYNLFCRLPSGLVAVSRANDWFIEKDYLGIQTLYAFASNLYNAKLSTGDNKMPDNIRDFYSEINQIMRKKFRTFINNDMTVDDLNTFNRLYVLMCNKVAQSSADEFNDRLHGIPSNSRISVYETIIKQFFRVNALSYILTGLDNNRPFAVEIPDLTSWKKDWVVISVHATPRLDSHQSIVEIKIVVKNKVTGQQFSLPFHVEIRWSHGKFCGNPEGKLYKEFSWVDTPFFVTII